MKFVLIFILFASIAFQDAYGSEYVPILNPDQIHNIPKFGFAISTSISDPNMDGIPDKQIVRLWRCESKYDYWIPILVLNFKEPDNIKDLLNKAVSKGLIGNWERYSWKIGEARYGSNWADIIGNLKDDDGDGQIDYEDEDVDGIPDINELKDIKKDHYLVLLRT